MKTTITIPFPPSVNSIWRSVKGRNILSKKYREWRTLASQEIMIQRPKAIESKVIVHILLDRPDKRKRDIDNYIKAPLDTLVHMDLIEDDSLVETLTIGWSGKTGKTACISFWSAQ